MRFADPKNRYTLYKMQKN